ncbi:MAG TPA: lycopene cyclase family protein [Pseudonocardia sp.]
MLDVLVVGAGPAGRAVAAACGERGLRTEVLDPAPGRPWRATYGAWADELPPGLPAEVVAATTATTRAVARTEHRLDRRYAVLDVPALRRHLDDRLAAADVAVRRGRGRPGALPPAGVVIDAGGPAQPLSSPRRAGGVWAEQTAVGLVLPAEAAAPLLGEDEALFMDWRPADTADPAVGSDWPTFLYAVPLGGGRVLLEETSLARRPGLDLDTLERRLRTRLAGHGIRPPGDPPREVVRFPLDLPRHRAAGVVGFGASAPLTHPATGYQLATALRLAGPLADALAAGLGGPGGGQAAALHRAGRLLWPAPARAVDLLRRRGLESLLRLPPARLADFFEGFFALPAARQRAYLGGRTDVAGTLGAMTAMFRTTEWPVRLRLIGSSLLVRASPRSTVRSSVK